MNLSPFPITPRVKGRLILLLVYFVAFGLGFWVSTVSNYSILLKSVVATAVTVTIIFLGSLDFNNSSVFDPYWSVAPPLMLLYFAALFYYPAVFEYGPPVVKTGHSLVVTIPFSGNALHPFGTGGSWYQAPRLMILFLLILVYSIRLTGNFLSGWPGLKHEDWRYISFREKTKNGYWPVSFLAIHFFPALMVFGGTLSLWVVVVHGYKPLNFLDILALFVTGFAIILEGMADRQLHRFLRETKDSGKTMNTGLWSCSRHPNYLGEILFWWGLFLFALAANPSFWWVIAGPLAITLMFLFASIPMIEKRMLSHRTDYLEYKRKVPMLIPWKKR